MKWINKIRNTFFCFACVTTCVVFVTAAYITIFWGEISLEVDILWQILFVSLLCSIAVMFYPGREVSTKTAMLIMILHYLEVNVIVMGFGLWFEWFDPDNLPMVLGMLFVIALVFALISAIMWTKNKRIAAQINEKLQKFQTE